MSRRPNRATSTSTFGVGRRESHDASEFYARFHPKHLSTDSTVELVPDLAEPLVCGDARDLKLPDSSVALVVTSPPYFAGKEYEETLGQGMVPASYADYLELLRDVFAECVRVLEPGGRIAVNVANLGRRPFRSLAGDVTRILDDDLGLLLRGEVVWVKAGGASGSCAWGSYRSPTNPVLRDVSERVIVASKGRFDRAVDVETRRTSGLPFESTVTTDEFLAATLDVWRIDPESARRVGHPAPFPVELPQRLIELYTFRDDLVLDPFLGSGSTAVAAVRTDRRFVGYDTDADYVALAAGRVAQARAARARAASPGMAAPVAGARVDDPGAAAQSLAADLLVRAGFTIEERNRKVPGIGVTVGVVARDAAGAQWFFDVTGAFTSTRAGLARSDTLWRCLGRAGVLAARRLGPLVFLSSDLPPRRSTGDQALRALGPRVVHDVVGLRSMGDLDRLATYAGGANTDRPVPGFWTDAELDSVGLGSRQRLWATPPSSSRDPSA